MSGFVQSGRFGGFNPLTSISWVHAWWAEGPRFAALGLAHGAAISTVPDEIGSADFAQATAGNKPTYRTAHAALGSRPAWDADGGDFLTTSTFTTINPTFTLVIVAEGIQANAIFGHTAANTGYYIFYNRFGQWLMEGGTPATGITSDASKHLWIYRNTNTTGSTLTQDATVSSSFTAAAFKPSQLTILGRTDGFQISGAAAFVGIQQGSMSSADEAALLAWSRALYGTP